jgi:hypothetical protein
MKAICGPISPVLYVSKTEANAVGRWRALADVSFVLGAFLGLVGLLLSLFSALHIPPGKTIGSGIDAGLLVGGLVLLMLGAHCEDSITKIRSAAADHSGQADRR